MQGKPTTRDALRLLMDGSQALARMEESGMRIDVPYLQSAIKDVKEKIKELEYEVRQDSVYATWRRLYGSDINTDSPEQIGKVVFGELGYPYEGERTATGKWKTDKATLAKIDLPILRKLGEVKKWKRMLATNLKGILDEVVDGYIHPSFLLHRATTYRSSSEDPNSQNFPKRDEEIGSLVRRAFIPRKGRVLVEIDFAGIEVRAAACYHKDPRMLKYLHDSTTDMHRDQAMKLFFLTLEQVKGMKKTTRDWSKNRFVFPEFYGSTWFQCAPHMWEAASDPKYTLPDGTPLVEHLKKHGIDGLGSCEAKQEPLPGTFAHHVRKVEREMWDRDFPVYSRWKKEWWEEYLKNGYFTNLTGFRFEWATDKKKGGGCKVPKKNDVINYPVQSIAFHWLLWTIIQTQKELDTKNWKTKLIGQIHDSCISDVPVRELQDFLSLVYDIITVRLPRHWDWICVPTEAEIEVGRENWFLKKVWTEKDGVWGIAA